MGGLENVCSVQVVVVTIAKPGQDDITFCTSLTNITTGLFVHTVAVLVKISLAM